MQPLSDPSQRDLRAYHVARQLHLLPQLRAVFERNEMAYPMFYSCLTPDAKDSAKHILLCLRRWLCRRLEVNPVSTLPLVSTVTETILSYLWFPELVDAAALPPRSFNVQMGIQALALSAADATAMTGATSPEGRALVTGTPQVMETPSTRSTATALSPDSSLRPLPQLQQQQMGQADHTPLRGGLDSTGGAGSSMQTPMRPGSTALPSPARGGTAAAAERGSSLWERALLYRPMFFVRPYIKTAASPVRIQQGDPGPHEFFIRMAHTGRLNDESLNPYFGRYGQVGCELLQRAPMTQCPYINEAQAYSLTEMFQCRPHEVLIQDFIVSVDSAQNAARAVRQAYYKELLFIAYHERVEAEAEARRRHARSGTPLSPLPASDPSYHNNNCYAIADVDALMADSGAVLSLLPAAALAALTAAQVAAAGAAGRFLGSAAERRRLQKEDKRRRRHERRERKRQRLGTGPEGGLAVASDAESEGSSASSSSSSSEAAARGALSGFVPHVVVDGFPYWMTEDQLKVLMVNYGTLKALRLSVDDLSGAFTGAVLVLMSSVEEAIQVSEGLHGAAFQGVTLRAGVLNEKLELESLMDGERRWPVASDPATMGAALQQQQQHLHLLHRSRVDAMVNERLWV